MNTSSFDTVEEAERALDVNTARLNGTRQRLKALIDERRVIFRYLVEVQGQPQAKVGRRAGVTPMAVKEALAGERSVTSPA